MRLDKKRRLMVFDYTDDGEGITEVPCRWILCPRCDGEGKHAPYSFVAVLYALGAIVASLMEAFPVAFLLLAVSAFAQALNLYHLRSHR